MIPSSPRTSLPPLQARVATSITYTSLRRRDSLPARLLSGSITCVCARSSSASIVFRDPEGATVVTLRIAIGETSFEFVFENGSIIQRSKHPVAFRELRQVRIVRIGTWLSVESEELSLGTFETGKEPYRFGIAAIGSPLEIDFVRWIEIGGRTEK